MKKYRSHAIVAVVAAAIAIQFAPVQRNNPRVTQEIRWNSPATEALARRACYDCHSNETVWPWYAWIAPVSWRLAGHVEHGRQHLNFSTWNLPNEDLDEIKEQLEEREMPLIDYRLLHSKARLTDAEYEQLFEGLKATYAQDPAIQRRRSNEGGQSTGEEATGMESGANSEEAARMEEGAGEGSGG